MAHLKLAGFFEQCAGLLIGDFHDQDRDHQETVIELLRYHLVPERDLPIITTRDVGHVWPLAPLPLNWPVTLERVGVEGDKPRVRFIVDWPGSDLDPEGQSSSSSSGSGS